VHPFAWVLLCDTAVRFLSRIFITPEGLSRDPYRNTRIESVHIPAKMIIRSHCKLLLLSCLAFICILAIWQQSSWSTANAYVQLSLFDDLRQKPIPSEDEIPKEWFGKLRKPEIVDPGPVTGGTRLMKPQQPLKPQRTTPPWVTGSSNSSLARPQPTDMNEYMKSMLNWDRPNWEGHWPPFADYVDQEYDPNRWEQFDM
jgi:hypothetical protein